MKFIFCLFAFMLACVATVFAQVDTSALGLTVSGSHPGLAAYVGFVLAGYELIVRLVPTSRTLSIVGNVLKYALRLSTLFDNIKSKKETLQPVDTYR